MWAAGHYEPVRKWPNYVCSVRDSKFKLFCGLIKKLLKDFIAFAIF
jgi:hypothetical protein